MSSIELTSLKEKHNAQIQKVAEQSGVDASKCYQCGKCTAGCPVAFAMDYPPRAIIRFLQLGLLDRALQSKTIWLCAGCHTCSVRCPKEVDIASVMETLRIMAKKQGYIGDKNIDLFHNAFLKSVERNGRVYEAGLVLTRNLFGRQLFRDTAHGLPMVQKGKISMLPHSIKDNGEVKKIFENVRKRGGSV